MRPNDFPKVAQLDNGKPRMRTGFLISSSEAVHPTTLPPRETEY